METQERKQFEQLKKKDIVNVILPTGNITCTVVAIDENKRQSKRLSVLVQGLYKGTRKKPRKGDKETRLFLQKEKSRLACKFPDVV